MIAGFPIQQGDPFPTVELLRGIWDGIHELASTYAEFLQRFEGPDFDTFDVAFPEASVDGWPLLAFVVAYRTTFSDPGAGEVAQGRFYKMELMQRLKEIDLRSLQREAQRYHRLGYKDQNRFESPPEPAEDTFLRFRPRMVANVDETGVTGERAYVGRKPVHRFNGSKWTQEVYPWINSDAERPRPDVLDGNGFAGTDYPGGFGRLVLFEHTDYRVWNQLAAVISEALVG